MANVIIGIHGLGNKPPRQLLEHWWNLSMVEGLENNGHKTTLPRFEMVYWADILHDRPMDEEETNPESPYFMDEKYEKGKSLQGTEDYNLRMKVVDFLGRQLNRIFLNDDFSLNYSFITDTLLNKYFRDLEIYYSESSGPYDVSGRKAKEMIRERLLLALEKHKKDNIMLICHSMGTIIAFDVLTFMAPHIKINTLITIGSPLGLPVVVGKIVAEQKQNAMADKQIHTPPGVCGNWYNFADINDNVALDYKLEDNFLENAHGVKPIDFLVRNNYESNGVPNPHKSYGYLRTPEFSTVLNDFVLSEHLSLKEKIVRQTVRVTDYLKDILKKPEPDQTEVSF